MKAPYIWVTTVLVAPAVLGFQRRDDTEWWAHDVAGTSDDGDWDSTVASEGAPMMDDDPLPSRTGYKGDVSRRYAQGSTGGWKRAATGKLPGNDAPSCTDEEQAAVMTLDSVAESIMGRGKTVLPAERPAVCLPVMAFPEAFSCFYSWGLKQEHAVCWAKWFVSEQMSQCALAQPFSRQYDKCHERTAKFKSDKRDCEYKAMGLSERCQGCHMGAQSWWDEHCRLPCVSSSQNGTATETQECHTCNDALGVLMESCGEVGGSLLG